MSELSAACHGRDVGRDGWPSVSVVVPVRNEAPHLERAVASILDQKYAIPFDVCLAVAPSDDGTEAVAGRIAALDHRVTLVRNSAGVTPAGLNAAIAATSGSIVVRVDGHAELCPGYIERAVATMCRTGAVNVGGMQLPKPQTPFEEAVAAATTSWIGTGGATYRVGGTEGPVDTVYLGVFDRAAGDAVGWFDESLVRNQDYELNIRLRKAGGMVWFDPGLWVGYRPRGTWQALAKQYYEYGWWKAVVIAEHSDSIRLRQATPAVVPAVLAIALVGSTRWARCALAPAAYLGVLALAARPGPRRTHGPWAKTALVLAVMHISWGAGFWAGLLRRAARPAGSADATSAAEAGR